MFKRLMMIGLLSISLVVVLMSEAKAQYSYLGGGWCFCSYDHSMKFKVPGGVVNKGQLFFLSAAVWYDNQIICENRGGNISFSPGIGHITTEGSAQVNLQTGCVQRESGGECTGTVVYFNSVAELASDPALLAECRAAVGDKSNNLDAQQCFLKFYGLENFHCRNKNDTPIEIRTKGVCTAATAETCTDPNNPSTCTEQLTQGVRYTLNTFDPPLGTLFNMALDDRCGPCVDGTGPCTP